MRRTFLRRRRSSRRTNLKLHPIAWILLFGIAMIPARSHAAISCPWLNRATAAGVLGGPVSLTVQRTVADGNTCLFQHQKETTIYDLKIEVHDIDASARSVMPIPSRCQSKKISLKGIGNEALMCSADSASFHGELVTGRVRNKKFVVRFGSSMKKDPAMSSGILRLKAKGIAEQVAGSLF